MAEKQAPTPEQIARIPARNPATPIPAGPGAFTTKPPEKIEKQAPVDKAYSDISKASSDLLRQADIIGAAMLSERAMTRLSVRQQIERIIENEEDRRAMREEIQDIEEEAARAEAERESGDEDELAATVGDVQAGISDLGVVAGAAEALRASGADLALVRSVLQAARDMRAGERGEERAAFRERGALIAEMARFCAAHAGTLRLDGMEQELQGLERAITALSRQAAGGTRADAARASVREAGGLFDRIRSAVSGRESMEDGTEAAMLRNMSVRCMQSRFSIRDGGLLREIDALRGQLEHARQSLGRGERVGGEALRGLRGRMELFADALDNLHVSRGGREALTLQRMVGRALSSLREGDAEMSAAQMTLAGQFARAGLETRRVFERHSDALSAGRASLASTFTLLASHFASEIERYAAGSLAVGDGRSRGLLSGIVSALRSSSPSQDRIRRASIALMAAERLSSAEARISRMPPARRSAASRVIGMLQRCLEALAGSGPIDEAESQLDLAERFMAAPARRNRDLHGLRPKHNDNRGAAPRR